jgi:hypothetical protein
VRLVGVSRVTLQTLNVRSVTPLTLGGHRTRPHRAPLLPNAPSTPAATGTMPP